MNKKTLILAQVLIILMMAILMSDTVSLIAMGPAAGHASILAPC